jgi:hypothetical protein
MTDELLLDSDLGEALHENEIEIAQQIAESIATTVRQRFAEQGPPARRDAHPKAHGCVSAEFRVDNIVDRPPAPVQENSQAFAQWISGRNVWSGTRIAWHPLGVSRNWRIASFQVSRMPGRGGIETRWRTTSAATEKQDKALPNKENIC